MSLGGGNDQPVPHVPGFSARPSESRAQADPYVTAYTYQAPSKVATRPSNAGTG